MLAIRTIQDISSETIMIRVPSYFLTKRVEIIILPVEEQPEKYSYLQEVLLRAPTLSDEELQPFEHVREWMNQWNVNSF